MLKHINKGELIFPVIALAYVFYMIGSQIVRGYHINVVGYGMFLSLPIVIFAVLIIGRTVRQARKDAKALLEEREEKEGVQLNKKGVLYVLGVIVLVFSLEYVGYLIGFSVFLIYCLWLMGLKSVYKNVLVTITTVTFIHFIFVTWLNMPLPKGFLD